LADSAIQESQKTSSDGINTASRIAVIEELKDPVMLVQQYENRAAELVSLYESKIQRF